MDDRRGQGLVEFALLLPILLFITMGAVDFGRAFFAYTSLVNAAREGAVYASLQPTNNGGIASRVNAELNGLLPGTVTTSVSGGPAPGSQVSVTVTYSMPLATTALIADGTLPISATAAMVVQ